MLHYNCSQIHCIILNAVCSVHTWYDGFCEAVIYIIQQPHQLEWEPQSVGCRYWAKYRSGLWMMGLELRTTWHVHVVYGTRIKQTLASTIVAKVPAWIRQRAAELLKTDRFLCWTSVEPGIGKLSVPHPCLDPHHLENSTRTSIHHTHVHNPLSTLVRTAAHRPRSTHRKYTYLDIHAHMTEVVTLLQMQVIPLNLKRQPI